MYQSIWELPTSVLNCLNEEDATKWMTAYNECNPESTDDVRQAKRKAWHSVAKAPSSFSFEIIASTDTIDRAKDIIDLDSTKKHMDSFIDFGGNIQNDHHNYTVGTIWDWKPCKVKDDRGNEVDGIITYGNLFGGDLVYDKIRRSFVNGMNKLSIAGEAAPGKYQCDERGCYTRRNVQQLLEISLCVEPMNKYCTLVDYNKDATFTKSTSAVNFKIQEYTIHKDQSVCPIMSLKKSLQSIGYDEVHAKEDGVHIPMSREEFEATLPIMHKNGLVARYYKGEAIIHRRDEILEQAFKRSIASGFCSADGSLSATIPRHVFSEYLEYGIIAPDAFGQYGFVKSLDDFGLTIEEKEVQPVKQERKERKPQLQTGLGTQPREPPMMTRYEDTAEYKNDMLKRIETAHDAYDRYMRDRRSKFYMQDLINSERNILNQDTLEKKEQFWKDMLSEAQRLARQAYREWARRR